MTAGIVDTARNAWLDEIRDLIDVGAGQGKVKLYTTTGFVN